MDLALESAAREFGAAVVWLLCACAGLTLVLAGASIGTTAVRRFGLARRVSLSALVAALSTVLIVPLCASAFALASTPDSVSGPGVRATVLIRHIVEQLPPSEDGTLFALVADAWPFAIIASLMCWVKARRGARSANVT